MKKKLLLTGANGQLGTVLKSFLYERYGIENVILSDLKTPAVVDDRETFVTLDVLDKSRIREVIVSYRITEVYHLAAILSANAEKNPIFSWNVNFNGTLNVMEVIQSFDYNVKLFFPSSIAVFGDTSPKDSTPQDATLLPSSNYGMAKVAGELWSNYFCAKYKMDVRGLRFPGIISYQSEAGGGTTDYAMEMYAAAVKGEDYTCFLKETTILPMMYVDDAMRAVMELMEAPVELISVHTAYNLAAISFSPKDLYNAIKKHYPSFKVDYKPDFRQYIADSWSNSIDDSIARKDWSWNNEYDLDRMTTVMIKNLQLKLSVTID